MESDRLKRYDGYNTASPHHTVHSPTPSSSSSSAHKCVYHAYAMKRYVQTLAVGLTLCFYLHACQSVSEWGWGCGGILGSVTKVGHVPKLVGDTSHHYDIIIMTPSSSSSSSSSFHLFQRQAEKPRSKQVWWSCPYIVCSFHSQVGHQFVWWLTGIFVCTPLIGPHAKSAFRSASSLKAHGYTLKVKDLFEKLCIVWDSSSTPLSLSLIASRQRECLIANIYRLFTASLVSFPLKPSNLFVDFLC